MAEESKPFKHCYTTHAAFLSTLKRVVSRLSSSFCFNKIIMPVKRPFFAMKFEELLVNAKSQPCVEGICLPRNISNVTSNKNEL